MAINSYWLASVEDNSVIVSLITSTNGIYALTSVSHPHTYVTSDDHTFTVAVDEAIAQSANKAALPQSQEPNFIAFILPPFWVGNDGRIIGPRLKQIESVCHDLALRPLGFVANDEAIVEEANSKDDFPASFVLLNLTDTDLTLSLVYLGKVKERLRKTFTTAFVPGVVENALLEIKSDSTLPPQIIMVGKIDDHVVSSLKNYAWIGKKGVETFLHYPEIKSYSTEELINIYAKVISMQVDASAQFNDDTRDNLAPKVDDEDITQKVDDMARVEAPAVTETSTDILAEVDASDLGFSEEVPSQSEFVDGGDNFTVVNGLSEPEAQPAVSDYSPNQSLFSQPELPVVEPPAPEYHRPSPKLPQFSIASVWYSVKKPFSQFQFNLLFLLPLALSPLLVLYVFYFSKAEITLFISPYSYAKTVNVTLDPSAAALSDNGTIPVGKKEFTVNSSASTQTTGQKTIGDKARGEITIFNKLDTPQKLSTGAVLTDGSGKKFTLNNNILVAGSTSNLDDGIINLGKTKATVTAADIGPDYNLAKDTKLTIKDIPVSNVLAKVDTSFSGGTKRQVSAVSDQDKQTLEKKINDAINQAVSEKIKNNLSNLSGIIEGSIQTKKDRVDYNREIGEQADDLTASAQASVTAFVIDDSLKKQLISLFLANENGFNQTQIDIKNFSIQFKIDKIDNDRAIGKLEITGKSLPVVDLNTIKKSVSGKSKNAAIEYLKQIPRLYNYSLVRNLKFLDTFNPLPYRINNILIDVKSTDL